MPFNPISKTSKMATPTTPGGSRSHTNGVLAITASQTSGNGPRSAVAKLPSPKLKLIVRRLAPGLTESEFISILGVDWAVGQGKVDWFLYKSGKDSKEFVIFKCVVRSC
jgi:regulator of nonsense transcripts 3